METPSLSPKHIPDNLGMPAWAWPLVGLTAGLILVVVVYGTCFVDPQCK